MPVDVNIDAYRDQAKAFTDNMKQAQLAFIEAINEKIQPLTEAIGGAVTRSTEELRQALSERINLNISFDQAELDAIMKIDPSDKQQIADLTEQLRQFFKDKARFTPRGNNAISASRANGATP